MIYTQSTIDFTSADAARDRGIDQAINHANHESPEWSDRAYDCLVTFIRTFGAGYKFMAEDFREWCKDKLPEPPSKRAYGGIIVRARNEGYIACRGTDRVKNIKAHRANAAVWEVVQI